MWPHVTDRLRGVPGFSLDPKAEPFWTLHYSFSSKLLSAHAPSLLLLCRLISTRGGSWPWTTPNYTIVASYDANVEKTVKTLSLLPAWPVTLQGHQLTGFYIMSTAESCYLQEDWSSRSFAAVTRGRMSKGRNPKTTKILETANVMAEIKFPKKDPRGGKHISRKFPRGLLW